MSFGIDEGKSPRLFTLGLGIKLLEKTQWMDQDFLPENPEDFSSD